MTIEQLKQQLEAIGFEPEIKRGRLWLHGEPVSRLVKSVFPVSFTRRRYGTTTYTWAVAYVQDGWYSLGDPWPHINPSTADLEEAIHIKQVEQLYPNSPHSLTS